MINLDVIEREILDLEKSDTSYAVVERLAWLYIVRDHLKTAEVSNDSTGEIIGNDFCKICSNVPLQPLMEVIAEHMETIQLLYPKEYEAIITRISNI